MEGMYVHSERKEKPIQKQRSENHRRLSPGKEAHRMTDEIKK